MKTFVVVLYLFLIVIISNYFIKRNKKLTSDRISSNVILLSIVASKIWDIVYNFNSYYNYELKIGSTFGFIGYLLATHIISFIAYLFFWSGVLYISFITFFSILKKFRTPCFEDYDSNKNLCIYLIYGNHALIIAGIFIILFLSTKAG